MPIEYTLPEIDTMIGALSDPPVTLAVQPHRWWALTQLALAGLLVAYLVGMVQDFQRVRDLRAEPLRLSKIIITKQEAWQRVHAISVRSGVWQVGARVEANGSLQP
jgi:hypothetical protein